MHRLQPVARTRRRGPGVLAATLVVALAVGVGLGGGTVSSARAADASLATAGGASDRERVRVVLASAGMAAGLAAWGRSRDDIARSFDHLSDAEVSVLADSLDALATRRGDAGATDATAMYLVLVALMRESTVYARVISNRLP